MGRIRAPAAWLRAGAAALLLLAAIIIPFLIWGSAIEASAARLVTARSTAAWGGFSLLALDAVLPVPSSLVATGVGYALGVGLGTLVNTAGLVAGSVLGLALGRAASAPARRLLGGEMFAAFEHKAERHAVAAVILCRAVPVLAEASLIAAGAGRVPTAPILAAATAADVAVGAVYAAAGAASGATDNPALWVSAAAVLLPVLAGLPVWLWLRRERTRRGRAPTHE